MSASLEPQQNAEPSTAPGLSGAAVDRPYVRPHVVAVESRDATSSCVPARTAFQEATA